MRIFRFVALGLVVASFAFAAATYGALPERVPMRLGFDGEVTRTSARSPLAWFGLPIVALLTFALLQWVSSLLPRRPELFNFPDKERFLRMPREYHAPVVHEMRGVLDVTAALTLLVVLLVQLLLWRVAQGRAPGALAVGPWLGIAILPMFLVFLARVTNAVDRQERLWREREGKPAGGR